jgi:cell wall-associated NlpC family hydrolase
VKKLLLSAAALTLLAGTVVLVLPILAGVAAGVCAQGGTARPVAGVQLDAEQLANAATIITTTRTVGMPGRAAVIAVATAMQESRLHNDLVMTDHDSLGLFQQRVSIYGRDTATNPVASTRAFLAKLARVPGWATMPLTQAAQAVQISAFPNAYAAWEHLADQLVGQLWPGAGTTSGGAATCDGGQGPAGTATAGRPLGGHGLPAGYRLPVGTPGAAAVGFALAQLGKPYGWATAGPDTFDCSGLVMAAWTAAGIGLPRTTYEQVHTGALVPGVDQLQPGDLLFIAGDDGTDSNPGHVGMAIGSAGGVPWLVQAPQQGENVQVNPVSVWDGLVVAIRRPSPP